MALNHIFISICFSSRKTTGLGCFGLVWFGFDVMIINSKNFINLLHLIFLLKVSLEFINCMMFHNDRGGSLKNQWAVKLSKHGPQWKA